MLQISNLSYRIEGRLLIDGATVVVPTGSKTGLVGKNGSGKTTLFRLLRGEISAENGDISLPSRVRIGSVAQEAPGTEDTVLDMVLSADKERAALLAEAETAEDPHRIAEVHMRLADIEAHSAEGRASAILKGLGFSYQRQQEPCSTLSGGWRMRVALAGVLFSQPDLLLLDEPTNYLDLEGTLWLQSYLATYPYTVIVISHDRDLLNTAVSSIVYLNAGKLTFYRGNYDTFEKTRRMQMELNAKAREKAETQAEHMQAFVDRFRYKASKAKQAQSRLKAIAKLKPPEAMFDEASLPFSFPQPKKALAAPMIWMENVSVGYGGAPVLDRLSLRIDPDDRIALVGTNGNGKSTFAKLLAAELTVMGGELRRARQLEVAYFAQHQMDMLKPGQSPLQHIEPLTPYDSEAKRRSRIAQMGLLASRMDTAADKLSGGERARLLLGLITIGGPGMIILDEPTNHLDIDSRDALVAALNEYEGAVLVISHDRHLIESTAEQIWIAEEGTIALFDGDISDYQRRVTGGGSSNPSESRGAQTSNLDRRKERQEAAARRQELAPLRKKIKAAEAKIERLKSEVGKLDSALANPDLYDGDPARVTELTQTRARFRSELEGTESEWLAHSSELEDAEAAQV
jgi:ATP-binding cassette subfamily F protein 3